jgi:transposase InsO family protein
VLFARICRENGIEHLLTAPRSPTTTGKIERFHRSEEWGWKRGARDTRCGVEAAPFGITLHRPSH